MSSALAVRNQAAILERVVRPTEDDMPPEAARALLRMGFDEADRARMHELAVKGQHGALSASEDAELDSYCGVGRMLDLVHTKARRALKKAGQRP